MLDVGSKVWLLSAENFSAMREHCPPEKPFAICYSPFAVVFGSAGDLPFRFLHRLKLVATKTKPAKAG